MAEARLFAHVTNLVIANSGGKKTVKPSDFYQRGGSKSGDSSLDIMAAQAMREAKRNEKTENQPAEGDEVEENS